MLRGVALIHRGCPRANAFVRDSSILVYVLFFFIDSPFKVMIYYDDSEEEITACNYILDNSINDPKSDIDCQWKYKIYTRTGSTSMQCCC